MAFTIDLALDVKKNGDLTKQKDTLKKFGETNNNVYYYGTHEIGGIHRTITRNHYVMTFMFETENDIISFIKIVKEKSSFQIEMIGYDDCIYKIIYASKKYLSFMEKEMVQKYKSEKKTMKTGIYKNILKEIRK